MSKDTRYAFETDGRVEIENTGDHYVVRTFGSEPHIGGAVNIGGRASGFTPGCTLELGGGDTTIYVEGRKDGRLEPDTLICIGFQGDAMLE